MFVSVVCMNFCFFFFKQKTAYEMRISDWSSDVCSSDLIGIALVGKDRVRPGRARVDRKARRAITAHRRAAQIFEDRTRLSQVRRKCVGGQGEDAPMEIGRAHV